ncbi:MAG: tetratricopeptide repeat protein, partial [Gammaproteobacteria bacterium]|nr:tetratricopeptide repeat protein [Gammaproteobacteria bacterium]
MQNNEAKAMEYLQIFKKLLENRVSKYEGRIIQYFGDACLLSFDSTTSGVDCAISLQKDFLENNLPVRIGMHLGEVVFTDDNVFGDGVNIASRIESMGIPGSILMSNAIRNQITNKSEFKTISLGSFEFKNVAEPMEVFALNNEGLTIPEKSKIQGKFKQSKGRSKNIRWIIIAGLSIAVIILTLSLSFFTSDPNKEYSIAVIPFDNIKVDDGNEWLSAGFTTDINSYLSKIKNLKVIDPYSAGKYKDSEKNNLVIGEELRVSNLLKGSVRQLGNKLTITVSLINIISDKMVWSESFQESFEENPLKIQQKVSQEIVKQLKIRLTPQEEEELETYPTNSIEAQRLFSEGLSYSDLVGVEYLERIPFLLPGGRSNLRKSVGLFEQAISLDPNYSEAYAEMAFSLQLMWADNKVVDSLIERSLEINPNTVRAYTAKGAMQGYREGNWEKAKEYFQKAIELKPNDATNQLYLALYFASRAEPNYKKALEHINIAQKLNPHFYAINYNKIEYLLKSDKIVEAEAFYKDNNSFFTEGLKSKIRTRLFKAKAKKVSLEKKDWSEAVKFYEKEIENNPQNPEIYRLLAEVYDEVLNDAPNFYKYAKLAYEKDSILATKLNIRKQYIFKRTFMFSQSKNKKWKEVYKMILGTGNEAPLSTYYYFKGDYEKAQIYAEKYFYDNYDDQVTLYAQQKKIKKTYEILNKGVLANFEKARVFAILEERDSM